MQKNKVANIAFYGYNPTTGEPAVNITNIAVSLIKDGSAAVDVSRTINEIGNGWYSLALTAEDTNAGNLVVQFSAINAAFYTIAVDLDDYATAANLTSTAALIEEHGDANWTTATQTTLSTSTKESIAKYLLKTSVEDVESTAAKDSLAQLILAAFHSVVNVDGGWTIYRTDDQTPFSTFEVITTTGALPITGVKDV